MKIFVNKDVRKFFAAVFLCMAVYLILALIMIKTSGNAVMVILCLTLLLAAAIFVICFLYFHIQNKILVQATAQITDCLSGNLNARIVCTCEGELYKLFHEVNMLASVLNAHAENELKAKEFLKNTIADISHQLKTPIAALSIYNGLIQNEAKNLPDLKNYAILSEQELDRIEILVQNLLKITKFDARTVMLNKTEENLSEMMQCIYTQFMFRAQQEKKKITLAGASDISLYCDRHWFLEAVGNIIKNALDHTPEGGCIHIEWKQFASVVQVCVKDNGSGIHPEDLHHIFKRFYRSRFSQDIQGIGLGLPLAKTIVEAHNGTIEVDSELGKGTVFTINFLIPTKL